MSSIWSSAPRLYHLREEQGRREVDLLTETASGQLLGIEIKAAATVFRWAVGEVPAVRVLFRRPPGRTGRARFPGITALQ
jgi:hypothetical protein